MSDSSRNSSDEASDSSDFPGYEVELREGILGVTEAEPLDGVIQPWRFEPQGPGNVENDEAEPEGHDQDGTAVCKQHIRLCPLARINYALYTPAKIRISLLSVYPCSSNHVCPMYS